MRGAQEMIDVVERGFRERAHRLMGDDEHLAAEHRLDAYAVGGELAVGRGVRPEREERRVTVRRDDGGSQGGVHGKSWHLLQRSIAAFVTHF